MQAIKDRVDPRVETFSCFYSKDSSRYYSHAVTSRLLTRVGINRRRATAEEDILYSIEVLNEEFKTKNTHTDNPQAYQWENYTYQSYILIKNDAIAKKLHRFINDNKEQFRLGGSISRGLGKVKLEAKEIQVINDLQKRIDKFNEKLKQRFQQWAEVFGKAQQNPFNQNRKYFTINLHSEAILLENWQRTTVISIEMLQQFTGVKDESLKLHTAYSSYDYRSGWNNAWGLMKDVELITNKGSVYLFSTDNLELWYKALFNLELTGVGERISEGFGQIEICHEFHLVLRENAV